MNRVVATLVLGGLLAACSGSSGSSSSSTGSTGSSGSTAGTTTGTSGTTGSTGSSTLNGSQAFTVTSSVASAGLSQCGTCGLLTDCGFDSMGVILADQNVTSLVCTPQDAGPSGLINVVNIQFASANYVSCANGNLTSNLPALLAPGSSFAILNENVTDEDICGNIPTAHTEPLAILTYAACPSGSSSCNTVYWAESGSVTLDALSASSVSGHFDVFLGDGNVDAGELTGTFAAPVCH